MVCFLVLNKIKELASPLQVLFGSKSFFCNSKKINALFFLLGINLYNVFSELPNSDSLAKGFNKLFHKMLLPSIVLNQINSVNRGSSVWPCMICYRKLSMVFKGWFISGPTEALLSNSHFSQRHWLEISIANCQALPLFINPLLSDIIQDRPFLEILNCAWSSQMMNSKPSIISL